MVVQLPTKRYFPYFALIVAFLGGCGESIKPRISEPQLIQASLHRASVLVVSIDSLRMDHLSVDGYHKEISPHIDAFASTSTVFFDAWSPASTGPASFAGMFTGQVPSRVFLAQKLIDTPTLADHFATRGYRTAFLTNSSELMAHRGFDRGFQSYEVFAPNSDNDSDADEVTDAQKLFDQADEWLRTTETPFFLWIHLQPPYSLQAARPEFPHLTDGKDTDLLLPLSSPSVEVQKLEEDLQRLLDLVDDEIHLADNLFGQALEILEKAGQSEDTFVVLTADHGEEYLDHGGLHHSGVFQEHLRVPWMIRHPYNRQNKIIGNPVSVLDLAPTLTALTGLPAFSARDGKVLKTPLPKDRRRFALAMAHETDHYMAVGQGTEKLILDCWRKEAALYDLSLDPAELEDLGPRKSNRLWALRDAAVQSLNGRPCDAISQAVKGRVLSQSLDEEEEESLHALGYVSRGQGFPNAFSVPKDAVFWAYPNPIPVCNSKWGATNIGWRFPPEFGSILIAIGSSGKSFVRASHQGSRATGEWVVDGMRFVARISDTGEEVAHLEVRLEEGHCGAEK